MIEVILAFTTGTQRYIHVYRVHMCTLFQPEHLYPVPRVYRGSLVLKSKFEIQNRWCTGAQTI